MEKPAAEETSRGGFQAAGRRLARAVDSPQLTIEGLSDGPWTLRPSTFQLPWASNTSVAGRNETVGTNETNGTLFFKIQIISHLACAKKREILPISKKCNFFTHFPKMRHALPSDGLDVMNMTSSPWGGLLLLSTNQEEPANPPGSEPAYPAGSKPAPAEAHVIGCDQRSDLHRAKLLEKGLCFTASESFCSGAFKIPGNQL